MIKCHIIGTENERKRGRTGWPKSISLMSEKEALNVSIYFSLRDVFSLNIIVSLMASFSPNIYQLELWRCPPAFYTVVFTESTYYWTVASSTLPVTSSGSISWSPGQVAELGSHSDCGWWCSLKHTSCMCAKYGECVCRGSIQLKAVLFCCDCALESTKLRMLKSPTGWWDAHGTHSIHCSME